MNPYLEQPSLWHQVHNRLIVAIADEITPQIALKYRVSIQERVYTSVDDSLLVGIADVAVSQRETIHSQATLTTPKVAEPVKVRVPMPQRVTERFLEIRLTQSNALKGRVQEVLATADEE